MTQRDRVDRSMAYIGAAAAIVLLAFIMFAYEGPEHRLASPATYSATIPVPVTTPRPNG
jgi:hypothetical protein